MPIDFSGLADAIQNSQTFIVRNQKNSIFIIGDLNNIVFQPKGKPGSAQNLLQRDSKSQRTFFKIEEIANSRDLEIAIANGDVTIENENGPLNTVSEAMNAQKSPYFFPFTDSEGEGGGEGGDGGDSAGIGTVHHTLPSYNGAPNDITVVYNSSTEQFSVTIEDGSAVEADSVNTELAAGSERTKFHFEFPNSGITDVSKIIVLPDPEDFDENYELTFTSKNEGYGINFSSGLGGLGANGPTNGDSLQFAVKDFGFFTLAVSGDVGSKEWILAEATPYSSYT